MADDDDNTKSIDEEIIDFRNYLSKKKLIVHAKFVVLKILDIG